MPYVISALVFVLISVLFIPSTWFEANVVKKRLVDVPKEVTTKGKLSLKRLTPVVINVMTLLNMRLSAEKREELEKNIQMAGKENKISVEDFLTLKTVAALATLIYFVFLGIAGEAPFFLLLSIVMAPVGFFVPDQWLKIKINKRKDQIRRELPYILNAMAVMGEAGLNLVPAMREVAAKQKGEMSKELQTVVRDVSVGESQIRALEHMAERCQVDEVNRFISALSQNIERGSAGITKVLRDQAKEVWENRKKNAQELGEKASMKLFLPLLLLALPATAIFILGPAIISILDFFMSN